MKIRRIIRGVFRTGIQSITGQGYRGFRFHVNAK